MYTFQFIQGRDGTEMDAGAVVESSSVKSVSVATSGGESR